MQASPTPVRKLISNTRSPPLHNARATGSASEMSEKLSSGMTGAKATISRMFIGMAHCATALKAF
jgi:hypothetical protein